MNIKPLLSPFNTLAEPVEVFKDLHTTPRWGGAFLIVCCLNVLFSVLTIPFQNALRFHLASLYPTDQTTQIGGTWSIEPYQWITLAISPLIYLLRLSAIAAVLYFMLVLFGAGKLTGRSLFAVVVHLEMIAQLSSMANVLFLYLHGFEAVQTAVDLSAVPGLDLFLRNRSSDPSVTILLNSVNPFSVWYLITLGLGLSIVCELRRSRATIVASIPLVLQTVFYYLIMRILAKS